MVLDLRKIKITDNLILASLAVVGLFGLVLLVPGLWTGLVFYSQIVIPAWLIYFLSLRQKIIVGTRSNWIVVLASYCLAGWVDSFTSSGGWKGIALISVGFLFYLLFFIVVAAAMSKKYKLFQLNINYLLVLLAVHIISRLFNLSDNGDVSGTYTFIEMLFGHKSDSMMTFLSMPTKIVYLLYLCTLGFFFKPYLEEDSIEA
jgi:hypothetical protein